MKHEDEWCIKNAKEIIKMMPELWKHGKMVQPQKHPPKSQALALILKSKYQKTYRELESYLGENKRYKTLGFISSPGKSTLQEAMVKIPESYLEKLEKGLATVFKKNRTVSDSRLNRIWGIKV
jgi:hypothetical protein